MTKAVKPLMPLDEACAIILSHVKPLQAVESVASWDADGRVLAEDVSSELDVPALDNTSMDGYAVRSIDAQQSGTRLHVVQRMPVKQRASLPAPPFPLGPMRWSCKSMSPLTRLSTITLF
jgi:molybdopterin molybdotransferase